MYPEYNSCNLCPRRCGVNRNNGNVGRCHESSKLYVARAALHYWEEPCISGTEGSGTVFFSGCGLNCVYCQNKEISRGESGKEISVERLSDIYLELAAQGANNINLVTPTHYVPHIIDSVRQAKERGLSLPIVYNTSGYEVPETLKLLKDTVDIFLADFRYMDKEAAGAFSDAADYPERVKEAFAEMFKLTGKPVFDNRGMLQKGIVARILMLPGHADEASDIVRYLNRNFGDDIYLSLLRQYTPLSDLSGLKDPDKKYRPLMRTLTTYEYEKVVNTALDLGIKNAYTQEKGTDKDSFIPAFDNTGV
ncbi:MAG: radical SAM protein [Lachnospiraceae bacterium]|nr:radical SAM protein [Lachnospiraceae bacterium]